MGEGFQAGAADDGERDHGEQGGVEGRPFGGDAVEEVADAEAAVEGAVEGFLDDGAVGNGVRKREADFDGWAAGRVEAVQKLHGDVERGVAGGDVGQQPGGAVGAGGLKALYEAIRAHGVFRFRVQA